MTFFTILLFLLGNPNHDIQVAFYKIQQEEDYVRITFVFEKEDVEAALNNSHDLLRQTPLERYLQQHFSLSINEEPQALSFDSLQVEDKHIELVARIANPKEAIVSLAIKNTCLLNIEEHSNIIEVRLHGEERDFLMNKARTTISINY